LHRFLLLIFLLLTTLQARENPFFPSEGENDIYYTNKQETFPPLSRATISLPSQARVIQSVTIKYKNLDGSIESKSIELENSVDWHLPLFISQSYSSSDKQKIMLSSKKSKMKKVASFKYASFFSNDKRLKIVTKDKMIRNFLLVKPHRIVLDFKRDTTMKNYTKNLSGNIFTKIRVGNHSGYYRVVLELDGYYRYSYKQSNDGYLFTLQ